MICVLIFCYHPFQGFEKIVVFFLTFARNGLHVRPDYAFRLILFHTDQVPSQSKWKPVRGGGGERTKTAGFYHV